jgi:hypothetical protein
MGRAKLGIGSRFRIAITELIMVCEKFGGFDAIALLIGIGNYCNSLKEPPRVWQRLGP